MQALAKQIEREKANRERKKARTIKIKCELRDNVVCLLLNIAILLKGYK